MGKAAEVVKWFGGGSLSSLGLFGLSFPGAVYLNAYTVVVTPNRNAGVLFAADTDIAVPVAARFEGTGLRFIRVSLFYLFVLKFGNVFTVFSPTGSVLFYVNFWCSYRYLVYRSGFVLKKTRKHARDTE